VARGVTAADLDSLRFGWVEDCPNLQSNDDFNRLVETVRQAARNIRDQFGLPPVLIVIDTLSAAGSFKDANDAAEGQRIMNRLAALSRLTGAFVLAVDHFGKAVETGTRGTSAKEAAADVVLALLADREINGTISNTRMALRKLRGGKVGIETPFDLKVVDMDFGETTCVVEWKEAGDPTQGSTAAKVRWPKSLRIFKSALETGLIHGGLPGRKNRRQEGGIQTGSGTGTRRRTDRFPRDQRNRFSLVGRGVTNVTFVTFVTVDGSRP
jgi:AAA domain